MTRSSARGEQLRSEPEQPPRRPGRDRLRGAAEQPDGPHRHPVRLSRTRLVALLVALAAAGTMLASDPRPPEPPRSAEPPLTEAYAGATVRDTPGVLPDGAAYTPLFFLDAARSVGTALSPDGADVRLLLHTGDAQRELRRMPKEQSAEFAGFTSDGAELAWVELGSDADGAGRSRIWAVPLSGGAPRVVTADTGVVMLFDKQGDLALHDGEVSWIADVGKPDVSALHTAPLAGGRPVVREIAGAYAISSWPWLVSEAVADTGAVELQNLESGARVVVGVQPGELMTCSPAWCRSVLIGSTEASTVIELFRPDGSGRVRTVTGAVSSAVADVAALDRFEIYTRSSPLLTSNRLMLYDLRSRSLALVSAGAGRVASRAGVLWWSTGDNETLTWHALDLRTLP